MVRVCSKGWAAERLLLKLAPVETKATAKSFVPVWEAVRKRWCLWRGVNSSGDLNVTNMRFHPIYVLFSIKLRHHQSEASSSTTRTVPVLSLQQMGGTFRNTRVGIRVRSGTFPAPAHRFSGEADEIVIRGLGLELVCICLYLLHFIANILHKAVGVFFPNPSSLSLTPFLFPLGRQRGSWRASVTHLEASPALTLDTSTDFPVN